MTCWPKSVRCLACNHGKCRKIASTNKTGGPWRLFQCASCKLQFSAMTGTLFHDAHLLWRKLWPIWRKTKKKLDEEFGEDSELDELYERLETKPNPYSQLRTACKLIFVASAQDRISQIGQTFANPGGTLPPIVTYFATCPDAVAKDLRALLDRTIQEFFRDRGIAAE